MTLIELTVSLAILALMVLAFGQILNSGQAVVTGGTGVMDAAAAAAAITQQLRDDLACQSPEGLLAIIAPVNGASAAASRPMLLLGAVGPMSSNDPAAANPKANAALLWYGAMPDLAPRNADKLLMGRQAWLLNGLPSPGNDMLVDPNSPTGDCATLPGVGLMSRMAVQSYLLALLQGTTAGVNTAPNLAQIGTERLFDVMANDLRSIRVDWYAFNPATGQNEWHGYSAAGLWDPVAKCKIWSVSIDPQDANAATKWTNNSFGAPASTAIESFVTLGGGDAYIAFWNQATDPALWPVAIRIRFELGVEGAVSGQTYEVNCPVRRPLR